MSELAYTSDDLALFTDLERATEAVGLKTCLVGAGAIQLGADRRWKLRLARRTLDWDFAVRVASLEELRALSSALAAEESGFERAREPHRFRHRAGGSLDLLPYGGVEDPPGTLAWPDGKRMNTTGLIVLDRHHETARIGTLALWTASVPAVIGLKLLAYLDRRPGITRDIQDVHALLEGAEAVVTEERILSEGLERLQDDEVGYGQVGSYLLGRDVGRIFPAQALEPMLVLLQAAVDEADRTVSDILRARSPIDADRERVTVRLRAFRLGLIDR